MTTSIETSPAAERFALGVRANATFFQTVTMLFKLRIVALLLFAGMGGAFLAARGWPGLAPLVLMTLTGGSAAAGASALNQYLERDTDAAMRRTRRRPLVVGAIIHPSWVLSIGLALVFLPPLVVLPFHPALAFWSLAGAVMYVGVYTIWLKPRSILNIVIGGLAGTCAVFSGGAAVGNWNQPAVIVLGLLVFLWTPAHFWSLAMMYREDYARVGMPMLPVRTSMRRSALWVTLHAAATGFAACAIGVAAAVGWPYWLPVVLLTSGMLWRCARLTAEPTPARARSLFLWLNVYLTAVILLICVAG